MSNIPPPPADTARFFNAARPPRTEPTYPPEPPPESVPSVSRNGVIHPPTPFALIAQRAERQPPKVVLTADEAAERMKSLKERQTEDPVLRHQLAEQRGCIVDLVRESEALKQRVAEIAAHLQELTTTFLQFRERMQPPAVAALPAKKIAAKKKPKA